jgi:hypothetical protein
MRAIFSFLAVSLLLVLASPFRLLAQSAGCGWESQEMSVPRYGCDVDVISTLCSGIGSTKCYTTDRPCDGGGCWTYGLANCSVGTRNNQNYQYPKTKADLEAVVRTSSQLRSCRAQAAIPAKRLENISLDQHAELNPSR